MTRETKIGDILKRIKRPVSLIDDKEYKLVTIRMNHKGVVLREKKQGALIKSGMYEVRSGDFILSGIDARNGAFGIVPEELDGAIVTNDFWYFEINEEIISKELFLELTATTWFDEICKRGSDGTTQRIRLQRDKFYNQTILLPKREEQEPLLSKIHLVKGKHSTLTKEIQSQRLYLSQLRQSIIQDAIKGKLTSEWRELRQKAGIETEPASELLNRIQAEKAKLIKEKKIKKEKLLPPVTEEEKPFQLPDGWEWCRLGELCSKTGSGSTPNGGKAVYQTEGIKFIRSQNVYDDGLRLDDVAFISSQIHEKMNGTTVLSEDLLLNITGGSIGRCCIVPSDFDRGNINQHVAIIRSMQPDIAYFLHKIICSPYFQDQIIKAQTGAGREGLPKNKMDNILIGVPSEVEQKAIVSKVESLMAKCQELEEEISQGEQHAQMLMQAVLKEAFENQAGEKTKITIHPAAKLSISPSKRGFAKLVMAGKIISECKDSREFTNIKFQKLQHLAEHLMEADLNLNYYNQAAGPYDPKFMHTVHRKMKEQKWFASWGSGFSPLDKASEIDSYFNTYFGARAAQFSKLCTLLGNAKESQCEIISTLYAVWNDRIIKGESITSELLIEDFYNWSDRKHTYSTEQLQEAIQWMKEKELEPKGFGELIKHAKKKKT